MDLEPAPVSDPRAPAHPRREALPVLHLRADRSRARTGRDARAAGRERRREVDPAPHPARSGAPRRRRGRGAGPCDARTGARDQGASRLCLRGHGTLRREVDRLEPRSRPLALLAVGRGARHGAAAPIRVSGPNSGRKGSHAARRCVSFCCSPSCGGRGCCFSTSRRAASIRGCATTCARSSPASPGRTERRSSSPRTSPRTWRRSRRRS